MNTVRVIILSACMIYASSAHSKLIMLYRDGGFFSNFIGALHYLYYCNQQKTKPLIMWGKNCPYYNESGWNGVSHNAWEYYFERISNARYEKGDCGYNRYWSPDNFNLTPVTSPHISHDMRIVGKKIFDTYIRLKPVIQQKIDAFYTKNFVGQHVIGIHYRGTDKMASHEAKFVDMIHVIAIANKYAAQHVGTTTFYVATDQTSCMEYAQRKLHGTVLCWDAYRSNNLKPIHCKPSASEEVQVSMAQRGEEALIDMMLLSRCQMLIRTASNLSVVSLICNPNLSDVLILGT